MYLPLDTPNEVKKFYKNYEPEIALFIRYDLWFNFIHTGIKQGLKFFLINARFQENHKIFKTLGSPYKNQLQKFNTVFCSDESTTQRLKQEGFTNAIFTGDIRFDRVHRNSQDIKSMPDIEHFIDNKKLLVLGSSWEEEEQLLEQLLKHNGDQLKVIIAPHDVSEERIVSIETRFSEYSMQRYTRHSFGAEQQILIFDTIGILSRVYQYADFALVGGGFSGKLHNILEPAVFGCFISFGPEISKFPEAELFIKNDFGYAIQNEKDWISKVMELLQNEEHLNTYHQKARNFVIKNLGANRMILDQLNKL
jgi:3-deoxy-D-manno-octulosonic-acid transferase